MKIGGKTPTGLPDLSKSLRKTLNPSKAHFFFCFFSFFFFCLFAGLLYTPQPDKTHDPDEKEILNGPPCFFQMFLIFIDVSHVRSKFSKCWKKMFSETKLGLAVSGSVAATLI